MAKMMLTDPVPASRSDTAAERPAPGLREIELALPSALARFSTRARAAVTGPEAAPVLVLMGGISSDRHPCLRADGAPGWWAGLSGLGTAADPARYRVLGIDWIADASGGCAPSPADQASIVAAALDQLGVPRAHAVIGASYGGMVALAFSQAHPDRIERIVVLCADAAPHPTATATRELQRRVVRLGLDLGKGDEALAIARGMAMLTYRCPTEFGARFSGGIAGDDPLAGSEPGAYLRARGEAFRSVMSPGRFLSLSASIDRHRVDPGRIATPALLIGAQSDQLVLPSQMEVLASGLAGPAELHLLPSRFGHDMFLKDADRVSALVAPFLGSADKK